MTHPVFATTLLQIGMCTNMEHPSALAHRSKIWESFQHDIQKKISILPQGNSDTFPSYLSLCFMARNLLSLSLHHSKYTSLFLFFFFNCSQFKNWKTLIY